MYRCVCVCVCVCGALTRLLELSLSVSLCCLRLILVHTGEFQAFFHNLSTIFCKFWLQNHCDIFRGLISSGFNIVTLSYTRGSRLENYFLTPVVGGRYIYIFMYIGMCVCIYICIYICTYIFFCKYIDIYKHI